MIELEFLGRPRVRGHDRRELTAIPAHPKRMALLAYLALARDWSVSRDVLIALFWPDVRDERARNSLRVALHGLRQVLGDDVLVGRSQSDVGLANDRVHTDVVDFRDCVRQQRLRAAVALYRGPFLEGLEFDAGHEFEMWRDARRREFEEDAVAALRALAQERIAHRDVPAAGEWIQALRRIRPLDEEAFRLELNRLELSGNRDAALAEATVFVDSFREHWGIQPSAATLALVETLRSRRAAEVRSDLTTSGARVRLVTPPRPDRVEITPAAPVGADGRTPATGRTWRRARAAAVVGTLVAALGVFGILGLRYPKSAPWLAAQPPANTLASDAFSRGEAALRHGRYETAMSEFGAAALADTGFAQAYHKLALAAEWAGWTAPAREAAGHAHSRRHLLSPVEASLLDGLRALLEGDIARARATYERVIEADPHNGEALSQLGETVFHWGASFGWPVRLADSAFVAVLRQDPRNVPALVHLARIDAAEGRADKLATRIQALSTAGAALPELWETRTLLALQDSGAVDTDLDIPVPRRVLDSKLPGLIAYSRNHRAAGMLARRAALPEYELRTRVTARLWSAYAEAAQGRLRAARTELGLLAEIAPHRAAEFEAVLATLPFVPPDEAARAAARARLARVGAGVPVGPTLDHLAHPAIYETRRLLLEELLRTATPGATSAFASRQQHTSLDSLFAEDYIALLDARDRLERGNAAGALARLGPPHGPRDHRLPSLLSYPEALERWLRAEALERLGRDAEALTWFSTFPDPSGYDVPYLPAALVRRGQILERLGRGDEAREVLVRARDLLRDADPSHRALQRSAFRGVNNRVKGSRLGSGRPTASRGALVNWRLMPP